MDRLNAPREIASLRASHYGSAIVWFIQIGARRFFRRWGSWGWMCLAMVVLMVGLGSWGYYLRQGNDELRSQLEALPVLSQDAGLSKSAGLSPKKETARDRLSAFETHLLEHAAIPQAVQDLLQQAEEHGLLVERGDYKPQAEDRGQFLRFAMSLPVKGSAASILAFTKAALLAHPSLALEGIRFKREGLATGEIEARLNWVLFARLPQGQPSTEVRSDRGSGL